MFAQTPAYCRTTQNLLALAISRILFAAQSEYLSLIPDIECVALISFLQRDVSLFLYGTLRGFSGFS